MPLISILTELKRAQAGRYALPLYDTFDMQSTDGMFQAAEERCAPVMIALYDRAFDSPNGVAHAAYIRERAKDATVPVSLMLDHGASFEQCIRAIHAGFTDVMFDGSSLSVDENIAITQKVVEAAHAVGVGVEAELGHVGSGGEYQSYGRQRKGFTDPVTVERFVAETGVDLLAVAIGTAHGIPQGGDPDIDLDLLAEIRRCVDVPLVLHGGSGCTEDQFRGAIKGGIAKINIATDLFRAAGRDVAAAAGKENVSYHSLIRVARESFAARCVYHFDLFGASGKAIT
ncbi:MAG: class II fructose-bisphosphate aldolase [Anaerolineae bacterium]|nr:class II fructose-bisphosphate aldolase [Anaerolineae bacterium]